MGHHGKELDDPEHHGGRGRYHSKLVHVKDEDTKRVHKLDEHAIDDHAMAEYHMES